MHTDEGKLSGPDALRLALQRYRQREHRNTIAHLALQAIWGLQMAQPPDRRALRLAAYLRALALGERWGEPGPGARELRNAMTTLAQHYHDASELSPDWTNWQHARGVCLSQLGQRYIHRAHPALWHAVEGNVRYGRVERALLCGFDLLVLVRRYGDWPKDAFTVTSRVQQELERYEGSVEISERAKIWDELLYLAVIWGSHGLYRLLRVREHCLRETCQRTKSKSYDRPLPPFPRGGCQP